MAEKPIALVTGASSGIGQLTARKLNGAGYLVFGTSRNPSPCIDIEMLPLDVTSASSIQECVDSILEREGRIDLLVNNAGRSHRSLIEETSIEDAREIFEINFWGLAAMTNAVLPVMRSQNSGVIVNVSSLAGLVGTPGQGFYAASKHAIEGYTETLRVEIGHLPIRVCLVEPGFHKTPLEEKMLPPRETISDYDPVRSTIEETIASSFAEGDDPEEVADAIVTLASAAEGTMRRRVGSDARKIPRMKKWFPEKVFIDGMRRHFKLPESKK